MNIEFIIPAYNRPDHLMTVISSIVAQTVGNWKIHVVIDRPDEMILERIGNIAAYYLYEDRIKFTVLDKRYNDWGHTPRNYGLQKATSEWVVMTGEDNYYVPTFVENFLKYGDDDEVNFVFCNMVHNYVEDQYLPISGEIEYGKIDIGNFMTRRINAQKLQLDPTLNEADYKFVTEYIERFNQGKVVKIDKTLYVHN